MDLQVGISNADFVTNLKEIIHNVDDFDTQKDLINNVLPAVEDRFKQIYNDNFSLSETTEDPIINVLVRDNLEVAFNLTEMYQEVLNLICQKDKVYLENIELVLKHLLNSIIYFLKHWDSISDEYKNVFTEELFKLVEVLKHLYEILLNILEFSVTVEENDASISILTKTLIQISEISQEIFEVDVKSAIYSWKTFGALTAKYSEILGNVLDVRIPVNSLNILVCKTLNISLANKDEESMKGHIKIVIFLTKILIKLSDIFYQQLEQFSLELLVFYVKISSFSQEPKLRNILDLEVFPNLDIFLQHLLMGDSNFKDHIKHISTYRQSISTFKEHSLGILFLSNRIIQILNNISEEFYGIDMAIIETVFDVLHTCSRELILIDNNQKLYEDLILNISAAILLRDKDCSSLDILLKNLLHPNVMLNFLALEIYTVVISNISPEERMLLLVNYLYSVNDLLCGYFTHQPGITNLRHLFKRMLRSLPNEFKDQVVKLFSPVQYFQIWRFIHFDHLSAQQVKCLIDPLMENTTQCIHRLYIECNEEVPLNIAESLDLLSSIDLPCNDERMGSIIKFVISFWDINFTSSNVLDNNILRYFVCKISGITLYCIKNQIVNIQAIFSKLTLLSCKTGYWATVLRLIDILLKGLNSNDSNKQILKEISNTITTVLQTNSNSETKQYYIEMLQDLNKSNNEVLNTLLDSLQPDIAHKLYQSLENTASSNIDVNNIQKDFTHKCLKWNETCENVENYPVPKKPKLEQLPKLINNNQRKSQVESMCVDRYIEEDESSVSEVIDKLKSEVKCLLKVSKTDKLTPKNASDLRIIMSQISSVMR
ncbi:uncharacterized protein LOC115887959 [Sitophilus oryzae]|uniref:Uncharacterized protein LOC115887959 n=1 Tax=Sitophilus oryzae TaxID=7048 RepID=A0A6J2YKJ9_SITOR|nr:uncharacterized protein LOC115887959 [Sitophilus oryzae]